MFFYSKKIKNNQTDKAVLLQDFAMGNNPKTDPRLQSESGKGYLISISLK